MTLPPLCFSIITLIIYAILIFSNPGMVHKAKDVNTTAEEVEAPHFEREEEVPIKDVRLKKASEY